MGNLGDLARIVEALTGKDALEAEVKIGAVLLGGAHFFKQWWEKRHPKPSEKTEDQKEIERTLQNAVQDHANLTEKIDDLERAIAGLTTDRDRYLTFWEEEKKRAESYKADIDHRNGILYELGVTPEEGLQEYRTWKLRDNEKKRKLAH